MQTNTQQAGVQKPQLCKWCGGLLPQPSKCYWAGIGPQDFNLCSPTCRDRRFLLLAMLEDEREGRIADAQVTRDRLHAHLVNYQGFKLPMGSAAAFAEIDAQTARERGEK